MIILVNLHYLWHNKFLLNTRRVFHVNLFTCRICKYTKFTCSIFKHTKFTRITWTTDYTGYKSSSSVLATDFKQTHVERQTSWCIYRRLSQGRWRFVWTDDAGVENVWGFTEPNAEALKSVYADKTLLSHLFYFKCKIVYFLFILNSNKFCWL